MTEQQFSNFIKCSRATRRACYKFPYSGPRSQTSVGGVGVHKFACLTSSRVMPTLLVQGPHLE